MRVEFAYKTDKGRVRAVNEDHVWVDGSAGVYIVADGLGGHEAGEVASQLAATTAGSALVKALMIPVGPQSPSDFRDLLSTALETANEAVYSKSLELTQGRPMGTVIVAAVVRPPHAYVSHVGDSRAYLIRQSTIVRLTQDDSLVAQLVAAGEISEAMAIRHPQRNIVTKVVGQMSLVEPSFLALPLQPGDWLLLCSDGLWDMVGEDRLLAEITGADTGPSDATEALVRAANAAGGKDNISAVAIRVLGPESEGGAQHG